MKENHPEWNNHPRQWYNPRSVQGTARKEHNIELEKFVKNYFPNKFNSNPEAHGVNLTSLMSSQGIELD